MHNDIRALLVDKQNRLWIGTKEGLSRYGINSGEIKHFEKNNSNLSHPQIQSLQLDNNGGLWVGSKDGLNLYQHETQTFDTLSIKAQDKALSEI